MLSNLAVSPHSGGISVAIEDREKSPSVANSGCYDDTLNDSRITILWLPQVDNGKMRPPGHYRKGIQFAFPALSLANTKIFPHCSGGLNRGPTMRCALLRAFGFPQSEAIARIRAARPDVLFHLIPKYLDSVERDLAT